MPWPRCSARSPATRRALRLLALALALAAPGAGEARAASLRAASATTAAGAGEVLVTSSTALTLAQLGERALRNNLRVRIDEAKVGEARALYALAAAQAYPRFSALALFGGPVPERRTAVSNDPSTVTRSSLEGDLDFGALGVTFRLSVDGALPLYTFGKIASGKAAASAAVRAAEEKVAITEAEVLMDVHHAFWAFQLTRGFLASLEDGERTLEKVLKKVEALLDDESPQVTEGDRLRLMHALATVRVKRSEAKNAHGLAGAALKLLVGQPQDAPLAVATAELDELPAEIPPAEVYAREAELARPELRALAAVVEAHQRLAELRAAGLWPDLFLGGLLSWAVTSNATDQTNPFVRDDYNALDVGIGLGVRMELDVFTKLAQLEQANAARRTREAERAAAAQAIDLEVRKIYADLESGHERVELLERASRAARGWLTATTLAYDVGAGNTGELIDAFTAWALSEGELEKTRYELQLGHADYARAAGRLVPRAARGGR